MLRFIYINGYSFAMREVMIYVGSIATVAVMAILLYRKYIGTDKTWKNGLKYIAVPIIAEMIIALTVGNILSTFIRGLSFGMHGNIVESMQFIYQNAGSHFIGMVIAVAILLPVVFRMIYEKEEMQEILNIATFFFTIQHIGNRLGCFLEGCCYGIPMSGIFSIKFPDDILPYRVFPSQLFEMMCMVILLIIQSILYRKGKNIFILSLVGFGASIFISEFFMDKMGTVMYFQLTAIQFSALLLLLICAVQAGLRIYYSGHMKA